MYAILNKLEQFATSRAQSPDECKTQQGRSCSRRQMRRTSAIGRDDVAASNAQKNRRMVAGHRRRQMKQGLAAPTIPRSVRTGGAYTGPGTRSFRPAPKNPCSVGWAGQLQPLALEACCSYRKPAVADKSSRTGG